MTEKPDFLPALPRRTQFTLIMFAVLLFGLAGLLILVSIAAAGRWAGWLHFVLAGAILYAALALWRSLLRTRLREAGAWWLAELTEEAKGFQVSWQPQRWRDLLPWRNSAAWSELVCFPIGVFTVLPLIGLVYAATNDAPKGGSKAISDGASAFAFFWLIMLIVACITVPFTEQKRSRAWFTSETVVYQAAPIGRWQTGWIGIGNLDFMRILTRGVRFEPDGVAILAPRLYGLIPVGFRIPTQDSAIRGRIRAWAETYDIAVSSAPVE